MKGVVVYSFAWRAHGHSPCNIKLAQAARRIVEQQRGEVVVVAQRTVAAILKELNVDCSAVQHTTDYENSETVMAQAAEVFRQKGITEVIPVAQPVLHLAKCIDLVKRAGFQTDSFGKLARLVGWIGFDPQSVQPWTRGPIRLAWYTILQMCGRKTPAHLSEP